MCDSHHKKTHSLLHPCVIKCLIKKNELSKTLVNEIFRKKFFMMMILITGYWSFKKKIGASEYLCFCVCLNWCWNQNVNVITWALTFEQSLFLPNTETSSKNDLHAHHLSEVWETLLFWVCIWVLHRAWVWHIRYAVHPLIWTEIIRETLKSSFGSVHLQASENLSAPNLF